MPGPLISIITPCYNHGNYIQEAVESVKQYAWNIDIEHIIVNDGSTDPATIRKLHELRDKDVQVIDQPNAGPANARNTAIGVCAGKYILPLDSDNRIKPVVFEKALAIMEMNEEVSVVYTDAKCFGDQTYYWKVGDIDPFLLLARNNLDTCALIRKSEMIELGLYDDKIPVHGNEDWDLWLRMLFNNKKFHYLPEAGFEYRVLKNSLSRTGSAPRQTEINEYIVKKYPAQYAEYYAKLYNEKRKYDNLKNYLSTDKIKSILKIFLNKPVIDY